MSYEELTWTDGLLHCYKHVVMPLLEKHSSLWVWLCEEHPQIALDWEDTQPEMVWNEVLSLLEKEKAPAWSVLSLPKEDE